MSQVPAIRYLTVDELVHINERLIQGRGIHTIVEGKRAVRDMDLLEAAVGRPQQSAFGEDAYPTVVQKATALLHSIARNHPFADGNKRTATVGAIFMLQVNGYLINWDAEVALTHIVDLAEGRMMLEDFAMWLRTTNGTVPSEPDADADIAAIDAILYDHRWLLNALSLR